MGFIITGWGYIANVGKLLLNPLEARSSFPTRLPSSKDGLSSMARRIDRGIRKEGAV
jgi:hypothetical protein